MKNSTRRFIVTGVGLLLIVAMAMYPPWYYTYFGVGPRKKPLPPGRIEIPGERMEGLRYGWWLFNPPQFQNARVAVPWLFAQCLLVALVTSRIILRIPIDEDWPGRLPEP